MGVLCGHYWIKHLYELLKEGKSNLTYLKPFRCKCFVHNNGKAAIEKFDAKSNEKIFLAYSSQSKDNKVFNKRTSCMK